MTLQDKRVDTASQLASFVAGQPQVLYLPNPGNAGDAAIACATVQLLERTGVHYTPGTLQDIRAGQCVIVGGGGNLVPYYSDVRRILLTCLQRGVSKCLLLPHSVRGHVDLLAQLDGRFLLLCRDHGSLAFVRQHAPSANCALARDLVLELDIGALERKTRRLAHRWALLCDPQWMRGYLRWRLALRRIRSDASGTLTTLRSDIESQSPDRRKRRQDLMRYQGLRHLRKLCKSPPDFVKENMPEP
ncbi:MAG: polysaccharide pyruvyl transferase family protein, partial [Limnohabitans sp.]